MLCLEMESDANASFMFRFAPCISAYESSYLAQNFIVQTSPSGIAGQFLLKPGTPDGWDRCVIAGDGFLHLGPCEANSSWRISNIGRIVPVKDETNCLKLSALNDNKAIMDDEKCGDESMSSSDISIVPFPQKVGSNFEYQLDTEFLYSVFPKSGFQLLGEYTSSYSKFRLSQRNTGMILTTSTILSFKVTPVSMGSTLLHACIVVVGKYDEDFCIENVLAIPTTSSTANTRLYDLTIYENLNNVKDVLGQVIVAVEFKHVGSDATATSKFHSVSLFNPGLALFKSRDKESITVQLDQDIYPTGSYILPSVLMQVRLVMTFCDKIMMIQIYDNYLSSFFRMRQEITESQLLPLGN